MKTKFFKHKIEDNQIKNNFFIDKTNENQNHEHDVNEYKDFYLEATRWNKL